MKAIIVKIIKKVLIILVSAACIIGCGIALSFLLDTIVPAICLPLDSLFFVMLYMSLHDWRYISRLHKSGIRTSGIIIKGCGRRGCYNIRYQVDGTNYICCSGWKNAKMDRIYKERGEITVLYDRENPQDSCAEKYDRIGAGILLTACILLCIAAVITSVYCLIESKW